MRCATTSTRTTEISLHHGKICLDYDTDFSLEDGATSMHKDMFSYESTGVMRTPFESSEGMSVQSIGVDSVL